MNRIDEAAVFWDIHSSGIKSPSTISKFVQNIRKVFKGKILKLQAYGDASLIEKDIREALMYSSVPLIDVPSTENQNQIEMLILLDLSLFLFDEAKSQNLTIIFVTNNYNMVQMTNKLKYRKNFKSVLLVSSGKETELKDETLICDNLLTIAQFNSFPESYLVSNSDIESEEDLVKEWNAGSETNLKIQDSFDDALEQLYGNMFDSKEQKNNVNTQDLPKNEENQQEEEEEEIQSEKNQIEDNGKNDKQEEEKSNESFNSLDLDYSDSIEDVIIQKLKKFLQNSKKELKGTAHKILSREEKIYVKNEYKSLHYLLLKYPVIFHTTKDFVSLSNDTEIENKILKKSFELASKEEWTNRGYVFENLSRVFQNYIRQKYGGVSGFYRNYSEIFELSGDYVLLK
eukprot:gene930-9838_t